MVIWKWTFDIAGSPDGYGIPARHGISRDGVFELKMPRDAKILAVQVQECTPEPVSLWALVDHADPVVVRKFRFYGTGIETPTDPGTYIGTFQLYRGGFVGHLFEICP